MLCCSMAKTRSTMLEVSRVGVEEEGEIELSLGLSIGGSFRKPENSKLIEENHFNIYEKINSHADPQAKHDIHTLQRREAREKREEKLRNGFRRGTNGGFPAANDFSDDKLWSESKWLQNRVREREVRENEALLAERACKRGKNEECIEMKDLNLTLSHNQAFDQTQSSNPAMLSSSLSIPVQYSYPQLQYVPLTNGFVYPYAMPYWTLPLGNVASEKDEKDVFHPLACRSFRTFQENQNSGHNISIGCDSSGFDSEVNSSKDGRNGNMVSNWSPVRCLSVVSDHPSNCLQGDSSSNDTKSHLSNSQSEHSASNSNRIETTKAIAYNNQSSLMNPNEQSKSETQHDGPDPVNKFIPASENPTPAGPLKGDEGNYGIPSLQQMPCVSTTGNGPNGKTIIGFLHRYTKTDVIIICGCHGSSFSPAEFVEHAGGKDILHPLKHITMISSSAFG